MSPREITLQAAQQVARETLVQMSKRMRENERGEIPDKTGNFSAAHRTVREIADLIESVLAAPESLLAGISEHDETIFEADPQAGLNRFLQELAFGDLLSAPQDIFDQLAQAVESEFGVQPQLPSQNERQNEITIRYIMQRHGLNREQATQKLSDLIAQYKLQYSREPDYETIGILVSQ